MKTTIKKKIITIGIAEDHQVMLDGLKKLLNEYDDIEILLTANNGKTLLDELKQNQPNVVIMDINMPETDGLQATKIIKKDYPQVKVLILSMYDDLRLIKELLKIGADGFVVKNTGIEEIKTAIDAIAQGETYFCKPISDKIMKALMQSNAIKIKSENQYLPVNITAREHEILKLISMEYTSSEIAGELFISINTVETHRKNLLSKLKCKNSIGLVKYALNEGLV